MFKKRRWWRRFIAYCLRQECAEKMAGNKRTIVEVLNERGRAVALYLDYDRYGEVRDADYWRGYKDAINWLLKMKEKK